MRACSERSTTSQTCPLAGHSLPCPRQESNLDLPLRRRSSYPLDYEGAADRTREGLQAKATGAAQLRLLIAPRGHSHGPLPIRTLRVDLVDRAQRHVGRACGPFDCVATTG
jgi:hypothetical protein